MALVSVDYLLEKADKGLYAVGAFNCNNMEIVQAIAEAAERENSPVIIQASQGAIKYAGVNYVVRLVETAAESVSVPIALHLDHGTDFEQILKCIRYGFTSVMIDGSKYSLDDNIAITRKVLEIAKPLGVSVEAEIGKIGGTEDDIVVSEKEAMFTDPREALRFVEETGVRSLAVAVGTAHGQYKGEPELDFARLQRIKETVQIPIVLHGSSGVPERDIQKAISLGICKVNIDTNIREAFTEGVKKAIADNPREIDPRKILGPAKDRMREIVQEKIRVFGSNNKA